MNTVTDLFDAIGGAAEMARCIDVKPSAASEMKRRGTIPVKYWPKLAAVCRARRIRLSYDDLVRLHTSEAA